MRQIGFLNPANPSQPTVELSTDVLGKEACMMLLFGSTLLVRTIIFIVQQDQHSKTFSKSVANSIPQEYF